MGSPLVILFPDHNGVGTLGEFGKTLLARYDVSSAKDAVHLIPVVHTTAADRAREIPQACDRRFEPVCCSGSGGLAHTLTHGYKAVSMLYPDATVVRLDATKPGMIKEIPALQEDVDNGYRMVIGDLAFAAAPLLPESADEFMQRDVCPNLFRLLTDGRIRISGSHGFQAFAPGMVPEALPEALELLSKASACVGYRLCWGLDLAMAFACISLGHRVHVHRVRSTGFRIRPREKVAAQLTAYIALTAVALRRYHW